MFVLAEPTLTVVGGEFAADPATPVFNIVPGPDRRCRTVSNNFRRDVLRLVDIRFRRETGRLTSARYREGGAWWNRADDALCMSGMHNAVDILVPCNLARRLARGRVPFLRRRGSGAPSNEGEKGEKRG